MAALVIDSSLSAAWCFPDERTDYTNAILLAVSAPLEALAPRLWAYEVHNSVLMGLRRKRITHPDAQEFFESLKGLPIRLADPVSYDVVFGLADRHGLTVYDAAYLLPFGARSRFLFKMDFAEAEYISRLRSGVKGHFSYREIAWEMKVKMEQLEPELGRLIDATPPWVEDPLKR